MRRDWEEQAPLSEKAGEPTGPKRFRGQPQLGRALRGEDSRPWSGQYGGSCPL